MAGIHHVNLVQGPFWCCGRQQAGRSEPLETRISGWKGACSRWNLLSLSVLICRMGVQLEVSHWGVVSGRMMAVRARPKLRQQTSQGWLVAVPSSELWAGPQRRGHGQAQRDASGFSQVQGWCIWLGLTKLCSVMRGRPWERWELGSSLPTRIL